MRLGIGSILLTILTIISSCSTNNQPECLLSKGQMAAILTDLHISEKEVEFQQFPADSVSIAFHSIYKKEALEKQHVSQECFEQSLTYYNSNVAELGEVYRLVVDSLSLRESIIEAKERKINSAANETTKDE